MRVLRNLGHLRAKKPFVVIREAIRVAASASFRIVHFSVQSNHLHLIVEADDARSLGRGMQGLSIRIARGLNRLLRRSGPVFADRYHRHDLVSRRETRAGIAYVLQNFRKHSWQRGERRPPGWIDDCSSGPWFAQWAEQIPLPSEPPPVADPETWLLQKGWQLYGLISPDEIPGHRAKPR
jgi:REP element-mobilizing transposase RayT